MRDGEDGTACEGDPRDLSFHPPARTKPDGSPIELTGIAISAVRDDGMLLSNQVERNAFEVYKRLTAR
jgi:hypothetical protein